MSPRSLISVFILSAAFVPQIARAQYGLSSSSNSNALGYYSGTPASSPASDSHTGTVGPVSSSVGSYAGDLYEEGGGSASGTANYGSLKAAAGGGGEGGSGNGNDTSQWFDTLTITSATLSYGSPVILVANAHYTGMLSVFVGNPLPNGISSGLGSASVTFQSDIGAVPLSYNTSFSLGASPFGVGTQTLPIDQTVQQSITTYVGATLTLDSKITLLANGVGNGFKASGYGSGTVDSIFGVQSQTAGVSLTYASGFAAVPEPSALSLLVGMATVGVAVLRKRRKE